MKDHSLDYQYIIKKIGKNKVQDRYAFLYQTALKFIEHRSLKEYIRVSEDSIRDICTNYFADIVRLKDFHDIERTNPYKVAGYTIFWILRIKPLQKVKDLAFDAIEKSGLYSRNINEMFALNLLFSMVFNTEERMNQNLKDLKKWNFLCDGIYYFMVYRMVTPQSLELILTALATNQAYPDL